ncbi:MAG: radical SAM protein [Planctomycetales bacterium]|nr:radical SAM protein [Planctomycetales bacterium]
MHIALCDTRQGGVFKDFAGGFGVGTFRGRSVRGKVIEHFFNRDIRPSALALGYLAAGLKRLGHTVEYCLDELAPADAHVFLPALMTVPRERTLIREINTRWPQSRVLVLGQVASTIPEAFADLNCQVLAGEPEQLAAKWDDVLSSTERAVQLGTIANLDDLPFPDWSPFPHQRFRVGYDFWKFPTAYVQSSRGCTLSCSYCPYIILENKVRTRSPDSVAEEIRHDYDTYGFRSFKFRDPLFGAHKKHLVEIAEHIGNLPRKIQFSVESRIELLPRETLRILRDVGLTSVTVGIETPNRDTLLKYHRAPIRNDKQSHFVDMCRELGIRVVAGFMIGFPEDTRESIRAVLRYAKRVNPFVANFNVCTPYPGTEFLDDIQGQIDSRDWSRYDVYTPNLKYENLTTEQMVALHQDCFRHYYWRWPWLSANWQYLMPRLHSLLSPLFGPRHRETAAALPVTAMALDVIDQPKVA